MNDLMRARPRRTVTAPAELLAEGAVVRPEDADPVALNPTALALWELCDGETAVAEMVSAVAVLFAIDPSAARVDVESALHDMLATGVIR